MHETDLHSSLLSGGNYRRLKTILVLITVYGLTIGLHFAPWWRWVLLGFFGIHALRLIFAPPLTAIAPNPEINYQNERSQVKGAQKLTVMHESQKSLVAPNATKGQNAN
ncbi:MAG: hypothetical protein ACK451_20940, partial [Pseudanabaena sp.]